MPTTVAIEPTESVEYTIHLSDSAAPAEPLSGSQTYYPDEGLIAGYSSYWTATAEIDGRVERVNAAGADITIADNPPADESGDTDDTDSGGGGGTSDGSDGDETSDGAGDTSGRQVIEDFEAGLSAWADTDDVRRTEAAISGDWSLVHDGDGFAKVTSGSGVDNPLGRYPQRGETASYLVDPGALDGACWLVAFGDGDGTSTSEHNIHVQLRPGGDVRLREEVAGDERGVNEVGGVLQPNTVYEVTLHYHADADEATATVYEWADGRGDTVTTLSGAVDPSHDAHTGVIELWFSGGAQDERVDDIAVIGDAVPDDGTDGSEETDEPDETDTSDETDGSDGSDGTDDSQETDDGYGGDGYGGGGYGGTATVGLTGPAVEPDRDGRTVYVASDGDDDNDGTADAPLATFAPVSEGGRLADDIGGGKIVIDGALTLDTPAEGYDAAADDVLVTGKAGTRPTVRPQWTDDIPVFKVAGQTRNYFRGFNVDWDADGVGWRAIRFDNCNPDGEIPLTDIEACKRTGWVHNVQARYAGNSAVLFGGDGVGGVVSHCDIAYAYGPAGTGGNADGVQYTGAPGEIYEGGLVAKNLLRYCSDDGFDGYRSRGVVVRDNVVLAMGYREGGSTEGITVAGKGIKLGGGDGDIDVGGNLALRNIVIGCGGAGLGANGSNLPNDFLFNTSIFNAQKSDRSYEGDLELWTSPDGGPSGKRLTESRVIGNILSQDIYVGSTTGDIPAGNIHHNHIGVDPLTGVSDGDVGETVPELGFRSDADLSDIVDAGPLPGEIWPTPASEWYGDVALPYNGDAPDIGAVETGD